MAKKRKQPDKKPAAKKAKTSQKPPPDPKAEEKKARKEAVQRNVARITKVAKTLMAQLHALVVEGWDEPNVKQSALKEEIGGLVGQISEHRTEIRKLARESNSRDADQADIGKRLGSLERDIEKWSVKLAGKKEERQGHRETMKAAMGEIRSLILDKAQGQMRLDDDPADAKPDQEGADTAPGKAPSKSPPTRSPKPATDATPESAPASNGTRPASSLRPVTVAPPDPLVSTEIDEVFGKQHGIQPRAIAAMTASGLSNLAMVRDWFGHFRKGKVKVVDLPGLTVGDIDPIENAILHHIGNAKRKAESAELVGNAMK